MTRNLSAWDRRKVRFVLSIVGGVFASGCSDGGVDVPAFVQRDSAGVLIAESRLPLATATCPVSEVPDIVIGETAGVPEYELFRVFGASQLGDGRIALVNQGTQQVRFYDQRGQFVSEIGGPGEGPGEFLNAFQLWVLPGDTLWVGDYRPWQFEVFAPDGVWIRSVRPQPQYLNPPAVMVVLDGGVSVLADRAISSGSSEPFPLREITLVTHGPDGALTDSLGTYPSGRYGRVPENPSTVLVYPLFEPFLRTAGSGQLLAIGHMSEASVSLFDATANMTLRRIVRWDDGRDRTVSGSEVESAREELAQGGALDPLFDPNRPVEDTFPAFSELRLGRDGRLWVREYPRPGQAARDLRWLVFGQDGSFACGVIMPELDDVLDVGSDYFLALDRTDLGIERVVRYSIGQPVGAQE